MNEKKNNTGDGNTGNGNTGHRNSGDWNAGHRNSGHRNSGHRNSGHRNSGHRNTGDWNSGNGNTGHRNSGHRNTGNGNSGNGNTGHWNSGHRNSGYFCTETPNPTFFDSPTELTWEEAADLIPWVELPVGCVWVPESDMSNEEKAENLNHKTVGGYLKVRDLPLNEAFPKAWEKLDTETKQRFLDLPNFDADKFEQITGVNVDKESKDDLCGAEITVNGKKYRLVEDA